MYCEAEGVVVLPKTAMLPETVVLPETVIFPAPAPGQSEDIVPLLHM
jgi:hypothetical protein